MLGFALCWPPVRALGPVSAQTFPTQTVRIVVPFSAGSVTDIMARIIADEMGRQWSSRSSWRTGPGCRHRRGRQANRRLHPDADVERPYVAGLTNKNLSFDPIKDFAGITRVCSAPYVLIVNPEVPAKSVKELIALANPSPARSISPRPLGQLDLHRRCAVPQAAESSRACALQGSARVGDRGGARRRPYVFRADQPGQRAGEAARCGRSRSPRPVATQHAE